MKSSLKITAISLIALLTSACPEKTATVYISDSSRQCEFAGFHPDVTAMPLINTGIDVKESACAYIDIEGVQEDAVCGAGTRQINLHTIPESNLIDAVELGYTSVSEIYALEGYSVIEVDCKYKSRE